MKAQILVVANGDHVCVGTMLLGDMVHTLTKGWSEVRTFP